MTINNRGQMGPIGEDIVYYTFTFILIAFFLLLAIKSLGDFEARYFLIDGFRIGQAYADKAAIELAASYPGDESSKTYRVLDIEKVRSKLTGSCDGICTNCGICVRDRRTKENISCGRSLCTDSSINTGSLTANVRLPVALRISEKEYHPAVLEVAIAPDADSRTD